MDDFDMGIMEIERLREELNVLEAKSKKEIELDKKLVYRRRIKDLRKQIAEVAVSRNLIKGSDKTKWERYEKLNRRFWDGNLAECELKELIELKKELKREGE